jgi:hypothetical protein
MLSKDFTMSQLDEESCYGILGKLLRDSIVDPKLAGSKSFAVFAVVVTTAGNLCASRQTELGRDIITSPK